MELGGEQPIETKMRWSAKIHRDKNVRILLNSIRRDDDICG